MSLAQEKTLQPDINQHDHLRGNLDSPTKIVEYGDLQCSHCREAFFELEMLLQDPELEFVFAFRHFPLKVQHEMAQMAAEATEAAAKQSKFWELHHLIYENQVQLSEAKLYEWAKKLKLDIKSFESDLHEHRYKAQVREDFLSGVRSGVNGTPTIFINGYRYSGPKTAQAIKATLKFGLKNDH